MTYCHISTQCDKYAEEEGRKQALEDEIERVAGELLYSVSSKFPWINSMSIDDQAYEEAKRIVTSGEHYE